MAVSDLIPIVLSALFGGGSGAAILAVVTSKANAKKIEAEAGKLEAEADALTTDILIKQESASIAGSKTAVEMMTHALEGLRSENSRLVTENNRLVQARLKDADRIAVLEKQVQEYSAQLATALSLGGSLQAQLAELRASMSKD